MPYIIPIQFLEFAIFAIFTYFIHRCGVGWKLFEELPKEMGRNPSKVSIIIYVVFVATELHPDIIFFQHILA